MAPIKVCYFNKVPNFGDQLNPLLLKELFKLETIRVNASRAELAMIGSILGNFIHFTESWKRPLKHLLYPRTHVFGTGFNGTPLPPNAKFGKKMTIHAVRGAHSLQWAEQCIGKKLNCTLGDPGLLVSKLYTRNEASFMLGIIPHHSDFSNDLYTDLLDKIPGSKLIDVRNDPKDVIQELACCKTIMSGSLHGLIVADSLKIPNQRFIINPPNDPSNFKFVDYYSIYKLEKEIPAINLKAEKPVEWNSLSERIYDQYRIPFDIIEEVQSRLLSSFPSELNG